MITWNDLSADEKEAMKAVAAQEPNTFFTPAVKSLAQKGLIGLMTTKDKPYMLTVEGGKVYAGRALLPAGEAVLSPIDGLAQLEAQARVFVGQNKRLEACKVFINAKYSASYAQDAVKRMFDELPTYTALQADLAAALERAQVAEAEVQRLQNQIHLHKDAANLAGMQYTLERENSRLLYSTLSKAAPSALADIKSKLNHSNTEGDKVLGEYTRRVQDMSIALKPFADRFNSWQKHSEGRDGYRFRDEFNDDTNWDTTEHVFGHAHYIYNKYLK